MKTAALFRTYVATALDVQVQALKFVEASRFAPEKSEEVYYRQFVRRVRQADKLRACILDDLVGDGWTWVTDDPKTRPMRGICVLGAWVNGTNARIVCASCWDGGKWRSDGPPSELTGWRLYAWQEWPLAPSLPSVGQ